MQKPMRRNLLPKNICGKACTGLTCSVICSVYFSMSVVGFVSTMFTVLGVSLEDLNANLWLRIGVIILSAVVLAIGYYVVIGNVYKDAVALTIAKTPVEISCGDIFKTSGYKVIGCDTHFDTRVDDVVISKNSLHVNTVC